MAALPAVRRSLEVLGSNYNKPTNWAEDNLKLWMRNLSDISDADLLRGVEMWCRKQNRLPNLARLRDTIEATPNRREPAEPPSCPACDGTGHRELARWFFTLHGLLRAQHGLAACDCPKGQRFAVGSFTPWSTVVEKWRANPYTEQVFHGTAEKPHLSTDQTMTPDELKGWKERQKKAENETRITGWSRLGDGIKR